MPPELPYFLEDWVGWNHDIPWEWARTTLSIPDDSLWWNNLPHHLHLISTLLACTWLNKNFPAQPIVGCHTMVSSFVTIYSRGTFIIEFLFRGPVSDCSWVEFLDNNSFNHFHPSLSTFPPIYLLKIHYFCDADFEHFLLSTSNKSSDIMTIFSQMKAPSFFT